MPRRALALVHDSHVNFTKPTACPRCHDNAASAGPALAAAALALAARAGSRGCEYNYKSFDCFKSTEFESAPETLSGNSLPVGARLQVRKLEGCLPSGSVPLAVRPRSRLSARSDPWHSAAAGAATSRLSEPSQPGRSKCHGVAGHLSSHSEASHSAQGHASVWLSQ